MKIYNIQAISQGNHHTLKAQVEWEDCGRAPMEVFFRTRSEENFFDPTNYNTFLLACLVPALHCGESRIFLDGAVCPWLVDNLNTVMAYLNHWYWYDQNRNRGDLVRIEPKQYLKRNPMLEPRVGVFFSGGVDSLFSLRKNVLALPEGYPGRISDGIFVHGFDFGLRPGLGTEDEAFEYFIKAFEHLLSEAKVNLIPVWTNVQLLCVDTTLWWGRAFVGPAMGAIGHALSGKLTEVIVASGEDIRYLAPCGTHPLIEPRLSGFGLRVHHDGETTSRIDKVKAVAEWPAALECVRVCFFGKEGQLNCGTCAKCLRTKLELLCAERLEACNAFQNKAISIQLILKNLNGNDTNFTVFGDLIKRLWATGHNILAVAVAIKLLEYRLKKLANIKEMIAWFDKTFLQGMIKVGLRRYKGLI